MARRVKILPRKFKLVKDREILTLEMQPTPKKCDGEVATCAHDRLASHTKEQAKPLFTQKRWIANPIALVCKRDEANNLDCHFGAETVTTQPEKAAAVGAEPSCPTGYALNASDNMCWPNGFVCEGDTCKPPCPPNSTLVDGNCTKPTVLCSLAAIPLAPRGKTKFKGSASAHATAASPRPAQIATQHVRRIYGQR